MACKHHVSHHLVVGYLHLHCKECVLLTPPLLVIVLTVDVFPSLCGPHSVCSALLHMLQLTEKLKAENKKLKEENRALTRVVARLST